MTIAQLYAFWIAYFSLLCVLIVGRPTVFARWPQAYSTLLVISRALMLSLLIVLVYFHRHVEASDLITFGLAFRVAALLMMWAGVFLTLRSLLRHWRNTAPKTNIQSASLWQRLGKRVRPQAAWGGILLFVTGYPIYHPALHNFVVAGVIALGIVAQATLLEWLPARAAATRTARHSDAHDDAHNHAQDTPIPVYFRQNKS